MRKTEKAGLIREQLFSGVVDVYIWSVCADAMFDTHIVVPAIAVAAMWLNFLRFIERVESSALFFFIVDRKIPLFRQGPVTICFHAPRIPDFSFTVLLSDRL
jgi:hypothetical protein